MVKKVSNFAEDADKETLKQFKECYSEPYVVKAAIMPDAHLGYVAPIGSVLITRDYLVPAWVGYDIGCGLTAVRLPKNILSLLKMNSLKIYEEVKKRVPMGLGQINRSESKLMQKTKEEYKKILSDFEKKPHNKQVLQFLKSGKAMKNLGSLGSGNHFISLNSGEKGHPWIVIHSGSRSVGHWAAKFYMKKSSGNKKKFEATHPLNIDSQEGKEYENLLEFGMKFARLNRSEIVYQTISAIEKILEKKIRYVVWANRNHNHAVEEKGFFVHRKGATPAKKGEKGIIPGNMRDGTFLVEGKGSKEFLFSSSHGAGRVLSRTQAKEEINVENFKVEMEEKGIVGNFSRDTLDEAPQVYKNIFKILELQKKSIKIINHLNPFINWQGEGKHKKFRP
ncbi:MAG: RtcB family protein [Candidatus Pacearchaeota archaeon]